MNFKIPPHKNTGKKGYFESNFNVKMKTKASRHHIEVFSVWEVYLVLCEK